jgi:hypothetical protein
MADDEAQVVWPDRDVTLSDGTTVIVRELRAAEQDRHAETIAPVRQAVRTCIGTSEDPDVLERAFERLLDEHGQAISYLVRISSDMPELQWRALSSEDGDLLRVTWLAVHVGPFGRRQVMLRTMAELMTGPPPSAQSSSPAN